MKTKIQKIIQSIKSFITARYIISGIIAVMVLFVAFKIFSSDARGSGEIVVKRGDVIQKVIVSGNTKPVHSVDLAFETVGKVSEANVVIGSRVYAGQILASLDSGEADASLLRAKADLAAEQAKLDEMKSGTRPEELAIAQQSVQNAESALFTKMLDAYSKADNAVHNSIDQLFINPLSTNPQFSLVSINSQLKINIESDRPKMETILTSWKKSLDNPSADSISATQKSLVQIQAFTDNVANAINIQTANANLSQATLDAYRASISTARQNIVTAITTVDAGNSEFVSAQRELLLKQNGSTPEALRAEEAKVAQYDAEVQSADAQSSKTILRSPINGTVTVQDAKVGEIVTSGKKVISVISDSDLEIESDISEISIGKVAVGNPVALTFDAFSGETFEGRVTYIEPAETIIDGVVNYKVTVVFVKKYPQMKSGLTSRLEIMTGKADATLFIPQYAISKIGDENFVMKKDGNGWKQVPVTVGIVGQDGSTQILSGLSEGDIVQVVVSTQ